MYLCLCHRCMSRQCTPSRPVPVIALACKDFQSKRAPVLALHRRLQPGPLARLASRHNAGAPALRAAARVTARASRPRAGRPEFGLDVDNIRPMQVVVGAALAMLALGKPLSGSRGFGGLQFGLPVSGDAVAKVRGCSGRACAAVGGDVGWRRAAARHVADDAVGCCKHGQGARARRARAKGRRLARQGCARHASACAVGVFL
jgi:hypothetical protein